MEPTLELVMIVKNSGPTLRSCLQSIKPYIQHWTIVDTGSQDDTPKIVQEELQHSSILGTLHYSTSSDFSTMRNRSLELSQKNCKYTLVLDDSYILHGGSSLTEFLREHNDPYYSIKIGKLHQRLLDESYYSLRIIRSDLLTNSIYKGRVHEAIYESSTLIDPQISFIDDMECTEHLRRSKFRFKRDVEYLLQDLEDLTISNTSTSDPNRIARTLYYIARTYYLLDQPKDAIQYYKKLQEHVLLYPNDQVHKEYLFSSMYDRVMIEWNLKTLTETQFISECKKINYLFPERVEPLYKVFLHKYEKRTVDDFPLLLKHISILLNFPPVQTQLTLSDSSIQSYYIPYLFVDLNLQLGNKTPDVLGVLDRLTQIYPLDQPLRNIKYMLYKDTTEYKIMKGGKVLVIHTGNIFPWDPTDLTSNQRVSGSEIMAMNMAKELSKIGFQTYVVGSFTRSRMTIGKVEYMDIQEYQTFLETYVVDYLIASRFVCNLTYRDNIKNVYLWVHDTLPQLNKEALVFQTHPKLFRGIITLGNWHKKHIIESMGVPENMVLVSRNAIYTKRFTLDRSIQRVPYQFIYTSCALRGLSYALRIIDKVHKVYPQTTLLIFTNPENVSQEDKEFISQNSYITLSKRISQEEIAKQLLQSDVWLYPTSFVETYCISALEAMCAGCLVVSSQLGGLMDTVGSRGILIKGDPNLESVQDEMVRRILFIMCSGRKELKEQLTQGAREWALQQDYRSLALEWKMNL